jgi:quercetin dioxygenase-like cupin family protein
MKRLAFLFSFLALAACNRRPADDTYLDPLSSDPEHYQLELQNEYVRVLRENLPAGVEAKMHSHRSRVSVYLRDTDVLLTLRGGEPAEVTERAGTAAWGDPVTHSGIAKSDVENISIELEDLTGDPIPLPADDATLVDPAHHVVELDNDQVRVVRMTYPAGSTSPAHEHLPGVSVLLTSSRLRNTDSNGDSRDMEEGAGAVLWSDGTPAHTTENPQDTDVVMLRVEMKRKPAGK